MTSCTLNRFLFFPSMSLLLSPLQRSAGPHKVCWIVVLLITDVIFLHLENTWWRPSTGSNVSFSCTYSLLKNHLVRQHEASCAVYLVGFVKNSVVRPLLLETELPPCCGERICILNACLNITMNHKFKAVGLFVKSYSKSPSNCLQLHRRPRSPVADAGATY